MKRITGKWLRESDSKELVAAIWPGLESFLDKKGFSFSTSGRIGADPDRVLNSISRYNNFPMHKDYELDEAIDKTEAEELRETARKDLLESRKKFIERINKFGYEEIATSWTLDNNPITKNVHVGYIVLGYENLGRSELTFIISPGAGVSLCSQYHGIFSNSKKFDRQREYRKKITDASNLIVDVPCRGRGDFSLSKEIKTEYRNIRREITRGNRK